MTVPTSHSSGSHRSAPVDQPEMVGGGDTFAQAACRALEAPVRVSEIDDGDGRLLLVEPLRFHAVDKANGRQCVRSNPTFHDFGDTRA